MEQPKIKIKKFGKPNYDLSKEEKGYINSLGIIGHPKRCHSVAQQLNFYSKGRVKYCEGIMFVQGSSFPIKHSWNLYNGKIIDLIALDRNNSLHKKVKGYEGFELQEEEVTKTTLSRGWWGLIKQELVWELEGKWAKKNLKYKPIKHKQHPKQNK